VAPAVGGDPTIVGRILSLDGQPKVVGVLPREFELMNDAV
jgi:hypothetical protein